MDYQQYTGYTGYNSYHYQYATPNHLKVSTFKKDNIAGPGPHIGQIHLVHLQIHKYFTDDSP